MGRWQRSSSGRTATHGMPGQISAKGRQTGGNGGFVEVSGKNTFDFIGRRRYLRTKASRWATVLLDPSDILLNSTAANRISAPAQQSEWHTGCGVRLDLLQLSEPILSKSPTSLVSPSCSCKPHGDITAANPVTMGGVQHAFDLEANNNISVNAGANVT